MEEKYIVLVRAYPNSMWTVAGRDSEKLDRQGAIDRKAVLTSSGDYAEIAIARLVQVYVRNPALAK